MVVNDTFDMIFHPVSNCYIEEVKPLWKECYRVLKKGGVLLSGLDIGIHYLFDEEEKILSLTQVYLNRKKILLYTTLKKEPFFGTVYDMTSEKLYLKTKDRLPNFLYSQILRLTLVEVVEDE